MLNNQPTFPFNNSDVSWGKANSTRLGAIPNEDGLHHSLNHAVLMLDDTNPEAQQVSLSNATATTGLLPTGSYIGSSFEANNFTITDHLEEEHKAKTKKRQFTSTKKRTLVFTKSAESTHKTYLASVENKMSSPAWGGYRTPGGPGHREIQ